MSWKPVVTRPGLRDPDLLSLALYSGTMRLSVGVEIQRLLSLKGGDRLAVELGYGEHAGLLKISIAAGSDGFKTQKGCNILHVSFKAWRVPGRDQSATRMAWEKREEGGLAIWAGLPSWATATAVQAR